MKKFIIASLASALMLSLGWLFVSGIPLLGALVPLLWISSQLDDSRRSARRMMWLTALSFSIWNIATVWWIWNITPIGAVAAGLTSVVLMTIPVMLYHYTSKRAHRALAYAIFVCGWITSEYIYTSWDASFPWLMLGNGFANDTWLVQWYEYTGLFGGSLWALACNLLIFEAIRRPSARRWAIAVAAAVVPAVISIIIFVTYKETGGTVTATVIQPNIDPITEKFRITQQAQTDNLMDLMERSPRGVDFIIMPETALNDRLIEGDLNRAESVQDIRRLIREEFPQAQVFVGATTFKRYMPGDKVSWTARNQRGTDFWYDIYNSALAIDSTENIELHHKSLLVIAAEKVPRWLPEFINNIIIELDGTTGQLGIDTVQKIFVSPQGVRSAVAICYESVYGDYVARFAANGAQILFIMTNDGWWGDTNGHRQHFSFARLRAIESRRSIARSANTGISGFINSRGDVLQKLTWDKRGSLTAELHLNDKVTFFARAGNYIPRLCVLVYILSLLYYPAYRIRRRNHLVK